MLFFFFPKSNRKEDLLQSDKGKAASAQYVAVAKKIRVYETQLHSEWSKRAEAELPELLKLPLLHTAPNSGPLGEQLTNDIRFAVNFTKELREIILEAKYLDSLGLQVPEVVINVSLREDHFFEYVDALQKMVERHAALASSLDKATELLLTAHTADMGVAVLPGVKRLNWNSLGVLDFAVRCNQAIDKFESVVFMVRKNADDIERNLALIRTGRLFELRSPTSIAVLEVKEFCSAAERFRVGAIEQLVAVYNSVGPLLTKVGVNVIGANAAKSDKMQAYYQHWEVLIFNAITELIKSNLQTAVNAMSDKQRPIFSIEVILSNPDIAISPTASELHQLLSRFFRNIIESSKSFPRWKRGTCEPVPTLFSASGQDESVNFTFYDDVARVDSVLQLVQCLDTIVFSVFEKITKNLRRWRKYRQLWQLDPHYTIQKFASKKPTCVEFDCKLEFYQQIHTDIASTPDAIQLACVQLRLHQLLNSIKSSAETWIQVVGEAMREEAAGRAQFMAANISGWREDLKQEPNNLDILKAVLQTISEIRNKSLAFELEYIDLQERFRVLQRYPVTVPDTQRTLVTSLPDLWKQLVDEAEEVDHNLVAVKRKFTEITSVQVTDFQAKSSEFREQFLQNGPAQVGSDLDKGLALMEKFAADLKKLEAERQDLAVAQQLFNLPVAPNEELINVVKESQRLEKIYEIYRAQRKSREEWSQTLWSNLNVQVMEDGINEYSTRIRRFPPEIKNLHLCKVLESKLKEFKDSLPLFQDLKNEALRERHWKKLMEVTKKTFDMNPQTFTLAKLFEMELHNFSEQIADITTCATKELSIEKGLNEVKDTWRTTGGV